MPTPRGSVLADGGTSFSSTGGLFGNGLSSGAELFGGGILGSALALRDSSWSRGCTVGSNGKFVD